MDSTKNSTVAKLATLEKIDNTDEGFVEQEVFEHDVKKTSPAPTPPLSSDPQILHFHDFCLPKPRILDRMFQKHRFRLRFVDFESMLQT